MTDHPTDRPSGLPETDRPLDPGARHPDSPETDLPTDRFQRSISVEDLARLKREREEADRRYNAALTELDQALLRPPEFPHPPPAYDDYQVSPLNERWQLVGPEGPKLGGGWRGRVAGVIWHIVGPLFQQQQSFNAALVDHVNRNVAAHQEAPKAIASTIAVLREQLEAIQRLQSHLIVYLQQITPFVDTKDYEFEGLAKRADEDLRFLMEVYHERDRLAVEELRGRLREIDVLEQTVRGFAGGLSGVSDELAKRWESMVARERRYDAKVRSIGASIGDFQTTVAVLQQAVATLKREIERVAVAAASRPSGAPDAPASAAAGDRTLGEPASRPLGAGVPASAGVAFTSEIDSYKYVGFEDQFRGSQEEISARVSEYLPYFEGAADILDVGCGRGEFLERLRDVGISARGLDINHEMVEVCRGKHLDVAEGDALGYLESLPDASLGGLFAAQVVEHLQPDYLVRMLDVAFHKLRPGSRIILETINPACWFAFFESYIRDITHVRPLHPDTLKYLLMASGFQQVDLRFRAPYPEHEKLRQVPLEGDLAEAINANAEKVNKLLFTYLDYAVIGDRR